MAYDLYLFDFDGVLFNTNRIKSEAFRQALDGYPPRAVDDFIRYHEATGGISRYIKFPYFFEVILGLTDSGQKQQVVLDRFSKISERLLTAATPMPGVSEFLAAIQKTGKPSAICSGGNRNEIEIMLSRHRLDHRFIEIWGNEKSKAEHAVEHISPHYSRVLFFGDARYDLDVAEQFGFDFVFVASLSDWPDGRQIAKTRGHLVIEDFSGDNARMISSLIGSELYLPS